MKRTRMLVGAVALGAVTVLGSLVAVSQTVTPKPGQDAKPGQDPKPGRDANAALGDKEALEIGTDAYVFGYPLVTMEMTRRVMTNVAKAGDMHAPMGQFARVRGYPKPEDKDVTAPNADTLYAVAWLDLSKEPYVFTLPEMKGRYFLMPMLDGWTNVFDDPGSRTTGTGPQKYVITGPGWQGSNLPEGAKQVKAPTNIVWILGRIYSSGTPQDFDEVHTLQDQMSLVPLSSYGKPYTPGPGKVDPSIDMKTPVRAQVNAMDAPTYFKVMSEAMKRNPPSAADAPMVERMAKIGLVPGKDFDASKLPPTTSKALLGVPKAGQEKIATHVKDAGTRVNGWLVSTKTGDYGTDYPQRAVITAIGLGANLPKDAIYPMSEADADGQPYDGSHKYVLHFDKGQEPPAKGFWSLTMYSDQFFFVPNPLNRYTLSSRNKFTTNPDGSVDLYLQKENPGGTKEANWLPAPAGKFILMMRLYSPSETPPTILDGSWKPPALKRADEKPR